MRNFILLFLSIALFIASCKKKEDIPVNPYAWVDDYCGKYNVSVRIQINKVNNGSNSSQTYDAVANITNLNKTEIPSVQMWHSKDNTTPRPKIKLTVDGTYPINSEMFIEVTDTGAFLFSNFITYANIERGYLDYKHIEPATSSGSTSIYITGYKAK